LWVEEAGGDARGRKKRKVPAFFSIKLFNREWRSEDDFYKNSDAHCVIVSIPCIIAWV